MWFTAHNTPIWPTTTAIKAARTFFFIGLGVCIGEITVELIKIGDLI